MIIATLAFFIGNLVLQFLPTLPNFFAISIIIFVLISLISVWTWIFIYCKYNKRDCENSCGNDHWLDDDSKHISITVEDTISLLSLQQAAGVARRGGLQRAQRLLCTGGAPVATGPRRRLCGNTKNCIFILIGYISKFSKRHNLSRFIANLCGISAIILAGFLYTCLHAKQIDRWQLPPAIEKKKILITGRIASLPIYKKHCTTFDFIADAMVVANDGLFTPLPQVKFHISWYHHYQTHQIGQQLSPPLPRLLAGDKWQLMVRLKRPRSILNPGGSDYEKYLWQHQIRAIGTVVDKFNQVNYAVDSSIAQKSQTTILNSRLYTKLNAINAKLNTKLDFSFSYLILRLRQNIEYKINAVLNHQPLTAMINALVIGDQSGITKKQWQVFRDTGTSYLMAIAGLHICLAAGVVFLLVKYLWGLIPRLSLCFPARNAAAIAGLCAAIIYSTLSGFSIPTQRALIMLSIFTFALLARYQTNPWHTLCLALLVILIIDPFAVLAAGFWLSFLAIALIFYVTSGRLQLESSWWRKYSRMQWAITLGLAPITLLFFAHASFITFIANIIAMPAVCSLVVPLGIFGSLLLLILPQCGTTLLLLSERLLELVWWWLTWLATFPQFNWQQSIVNWWSVVFAIIGMLLLLTPRGFCGKEVGILWVLPLVFYLPPQPQDDEFWLNVLDVGQGLATVIQTRNHVLVYDTGPKFIDSDSGENIVIPFLRSYGISKIDKMIISHGDDDHSGGANSIVTMMRVDSILASEINRLSPLIIQRMSQPRVQYTFRTSLLDLIAARPNSSIQAVQTCYRGQEWQWDGVNFKILHPPLGVMPNGNDTCCVLHVDNGVNSVLLLGDIPKSQEKILLQNNLLPPNSLQNNGDKPDKKAADDIHSEIIHSEINKDIKDITVVIAAHHGSATSSSPAFVKMANPQYVVFAAGYKNRFNFPASKVVASYQQQGAKMLSTFDTGAITFKFKSQTKAQPETKALPEEATKVQTTKAPMLEVLLYRHLLCRYWHDTCVNPR